MESGRTFWMVWSGGKNSPTVRHDTDGSAMLEAKRLAALHQGITFYVLEAIMEVKPVTPQIEAAWLTRPPVEPPTAI